MNLLFWMTPLRQRLAARPIHLRRSNPGNEKGFLSGLLIPYLCAGMLVVGCATSGRRENAVSPTPVVKNASPLQTLALSPELENRILALDPDHVTGSDVEQILSNTPAPRVINIHGGLLPIKSSMVSFSEFLIGMGYPEESIRQPATGSYTFGYYDSSEKIAGMIAWCYENEGLRPMLIGHSQGGIQVVRILYRLAGDPDKRLSVWNARTWKEEKRDEIVDPLTGKLRPVVGLQVPYAAVSVAGGLARILPNQWSMNYKLRRIPDSVEEFTGFQKGLDLLGGDFLGYGPANEYKTTGSAVVRNVRLPATYSHSTIPSTRHLAKTSEIKDWINQYRPTSEPDTAPRVNARFHSDSSNIIWAADVWFSIKKHWVVELQRAIRARRALGTVAKKP
jgi:hypothetical protein